MKTQTPFKRLILRAVLRKVSPMVIRVLALPDYLTLADFDEVFCTLLGWDGIGFSIHIHGHELTSFLRRTKVQRTTLREFQLRPQDGLHVALTTVLKSRTKNGVSEADVLRRGYERHGSVATV
jgi:hypothetical protein